MPNSKLPKLPNSKEGFEAWMAKHEAIGKFMGEKVKPTMAELLGLPQMSQTEPKGFGCGGCHTVAK